MLDRIGVTSLDELIDQTVPDNIRMDRALDLPVALSEAAYLKLIEGIGAKNKLYRSYIGQGYYGTIVPSAINRPKFSTWIRSQMRMITRIWCSMIQTATPYCWRTHSMRSISSPSSP